MAPCMWLNLNLRMDIYVDKKPLKNIRHNELKLPQEGVWGRLEFLEFSEMVFNS